jgi:hypothetical protein
MNAMYCCPADSWDVGAIGRLSRGMTEVIHVDLEELGGGIRARSAGNIRDLNEVFDWVSWQRHCGVNEMLCLVSGEFCHCEE